MSSTSFVARAGRSDVDDAIAVGAAAVWMQDGVINHSAAEAAHAAGLLVVMDRCMLRDHARLSGRPHDE
jgi:predicted CoA-binding protein